MAQASIEAKKPGTIHVIRVLPADDHNLVRAGIRALLEKTTEIEVVAEASDGQEAIRLAEEHQPDVVLTDIAMPNLSGFEVTRQLARAFPCVGNRATKHIAMTVVGFLEDWKVAG